MSGEGSSPRGSALAVAVMVAAGTALLAAPGANERVFRAMYAALRPAGDLLWSNVTLFGGGDAASVVTLALFARRPRWLTVTACASLLTGLAVGIVKRAVDLDRPPAVLPDGVVESLGPELMHHSMPSGHTATAFLAATLISSAFPSRTVRVLAWSGATLVAVSRVAAGHHWPADLCFGAAVGLAAGATMIGLLRAAAWPERRWVAAVAVVLHALAILRLLRPELPYPLAVPAARVLAVLGLGVAVAALAGLRRRPVAD